MSSEPEQVSAAGTAVQRRGRLSGRRRVAALAGLAGFSLLICLAVLELTFRLLTPLNWIRLGDWETLPGIDFKLAPWASKMNSQGFRDLDRPFKKPEGVFRVAFLGDSYVWGMVDYADNFPTHLERLLNESGPDRRIEIVNLGVPGYGPSETLQLWEHYATRYQPDAVIYGFFYDNDITDDSPNDHDAVVLGERILVRRTSWLDRSMLYALLRTKIGILQYKLTHAGGDENVPVTKEDVRRIEQANLFLFDPKTNPQIYDPVRRTFGGMKKLATDQKIPFFVMRYPAPLTADANEAQLICGRAGRPLSDFDFMLPNQKVERILNELAIPTGDITPEIRAEQEKRNLYLDTHWNAEGNQVAARAMAPLVKEFLKSAGVKFAREN